MTIGIYCIMHIPSGKRYIGKSVNIEARLKTHKSSLTSPVRHPNLGNRHLWSAVQKYGWDEFEKTLVECFDQVDERLIADRELYWIDFYNTTNRDFGYNLRRDSSTKMIVHEETRRRLSIAGSGVNHVFYGKTRPVSFGQTISAQAKMRHTMGLYLDARPKIAESKREFSFLQFDLCGKLVGCWPKAADIFIDEIELHFRKVYAAAARPNATYKGFCWVKVPKESLALFAWGLVV